MIGLMRLLDVVLAVAALPLLAASVYLGVLAVASRRQTSRHAAAPHPLLRLDVIVPAHNEAAGIDATVRSLLAVDYPRECFRVVVIADNCDDGTAAVAEAAGATVLVRNDPSARGKGYALDFAFRSCREHGADAVVVVDADSVVSRNLLSAIARRLSAGERALQAHYGVRNPGASWRTRLLHIAFTAFHGVRSLGRERLGLSCGLRGNGMAFALDVLDAVPHRAFSIVEDLEYGIALGLAGIRVGYVGEAEVLGDMAAADAQSRPQRHRWEHGRALIARAYTRRLLSEAWHRRSPMLLDLAADLLVPPFGRLVMASVALLTVCGAAAALGGPLPLSLAAGAAAFAASGVYVGRALVLSGSGARVVVDLVWVPPYLLWKLALPFLTHVGRSGGWVRTAREGRAVERR